MMHLILTNLIQTRADLSYAIAVIDRIGGWVAGGRIEGGSKIGRGPAASMSCSHTNLQLSKSHVRIQEPEKVFNYGNHQLGMYTSASKSRVDI